MAEAYVALKKRWHQSKTVWFNAGVSGLFALEANVHMIQPYVPGNVYAYGVLVLTVGNTVLRFMTSQGIALK